MQEASTDQDQLRNKASAIAFKNDIFEFLFTN